jgi:hypothetical protein
MGRARGPSCNHLGHVARYAADTKHVAARASNDGIGSDVMVACTTLQLPLWLGLALLILTISINIVIGIRQCRGVDRRIMLAFERGREG